jgi:hypothetical protein
MAATFIVLPVTDRSNPSVQSPEFGGLQIDSIRSDSPDFGEDWFWLGLDEVERAELTSLTARRSTAQALALRARIILLVA